MIIVKWKWIHENKISKGQKNTYKNILGEITYPKYKYINIFIVLRNNRWFLKFNLSNNN